MFGKQQLLVIHETQSRLWSSLDLVLAFHFRDLREGNAGLGIGHSHVDLFSLLNQKR